MSSTTFTISLRPKNQLTLPKEIVSQLDLHPGDRLIVEIDRDDPHQVQLRPVRRSYAGILDGLFGSAEDEAAYIREERASWDQ